MKRLVLIGFAALGGFLASASEYTVSVASGEKSLATALAEAYPSGVALVAGDTIVKSGGGLLVDTADATGGSAIKLTFDIREGAFSETVARAGSTYKVTSGAACVLRTNPSELSPGSGVKAKFELAGPGTADWPGALCYGTEADSWNAQYTEFKLMADAVIHSLKDGSMIFAGSSLDMRGHWLTLSAPKDNTKAYYRIRQAMTISNPGAIEIDSAGFSCLSSVTITVSGADKIPLLKLTNGARLGCCANFAERFAAVEFEAGTQLCKVYDAPGNYAMDKVIGCPTISAEQTVTIGRLVARADDLLSGHCLSAAGSLVLADDATLAVVGVLNGLQAQAYDVIAAATLSGAATSADPYFTASSAETSIALTPTDEALAEATKGVSIDVATDEEVSLADLDLGTATSGNSLRKVGGGLLRGVDVSDFGFKQVVVAEGVYVISGLNQIPLAGKKHNLTVLSGATARFEAPFSVSATSENGVFACSVAGAGVNGKGALVFKGSNVLGADATCAIWALTADATIGFEEDGTRDTVYHFSNQYNGRDDYNIFNMNGHDLTLRNATGTDASKCIVRVRFSIQFSDPGEIVLDGLSFTHGNASWGVIVKDAAGADALLPRIRLVNGAILNVHDQTFADKIACVEAESGTTLGKAYDSASNYALAQLAGCPTVTADQTVTVNGLTVRTDDLLAGRRLSTANVVFATETPLRVIGALAGLTAGTPYPVVEGTAVGSLSWSETDAFTFSTDNLTLSPTAEILGKAGDGWGVYVSAGATESRPTATTVPAETSGKTIVKLGGGTFAPSAELADAGYAALSVAEGSYDVMANDRLPLAANSMRVTVAEGATLRFGGSFRMETATAPDNVARPLVVTAAGSGADGQGAVVFAKPLTLGAGSQAARWTLTGDAVFGFATALQGDRPYQMSSFSASDKNDNVFDLAGHVLTLRGLATAEVRPTVRLRYACSIKRPGALVIDNLGFMHGNKAWAFNVTDAAGAPCGLPIRLVNGAALNVHDQTFADAIASVEAEDGTSFETVHEAASEAVTLAEIAGCPTVAADQSISVRRLVADAADLAAGRKLTAEGTFGLADGAVVAVNGYSVLTAGTAYPAVEAQTLTGTATPAQALLYSLAKEGGILSVTPLAPADGFVADVPAGETADWAAVTAGHDSSEWTGKRLIKVGLGTLALGEEESIADIGLTELVVVEGLYEITKKGQVPVFDGMQKLTVQNGATARFGCSIGTLAGAEDVLVCTAEGSGSTGGNGALVFRDGNYLGMNGQYVHWHLSGDAVYGFETANQANFSGQNGNMSYNDFNMNGYSLTLKCLTENRQMKGNVRIRYGISFYQPGDIILDNIGLTHGNSAWAVNVKDEDGKDSVLPCIRLVNGSYLNVHDQTFADKIGRVDGASGTAIGKVYDTPDSSYRLAEVAGSPWITSEQTVTIVKKLVVCRADIEDKAFVSTDGALVFAPGCRLEIDDATGLTEKSDVCFARAALGRMSGRARPVDRSFSTRIDGSDGFDRLMPGPLLGLLLQVR